MKIRNGFVSNSSSSSFLIKLGDIYPDTLSIAKSMILDKYHNYDRSVKREEVKNEKSKIIKDIYELRKKGIVNYSFFFFSTNENTYINKVTDNYAYVVTCNNIMWNVELDSERNIPDEVKIVYPNTEVSEEGIYLNDLIEEKEYYNLESGIFSTYIKEYKPCKKCYDRLWLVGGKELCLRCDSDTILRGLKLSKIKGLL